MLNNDPDMQFNDTSLTGASLINLTAQAGGYISHDSRA